MHGRFEGFGDSSDFLPEAPHALSLHVCTTNIHEHTSLFACPLLIEARSVLPVLTMVNNTCIVFFSLVV